MKKRVLLLDNDPVLNKINEKVLRTSGIAREVHIASDATTAIEYLTSRVERDYPLPDLIIFDLNLPGKEGAKFLRDYREMSFSGKSGIELIAFTHWLQPNMKQVATEQGIRHFLTKPYLLRGLQAVLATSQS